MDTLTKEEDRLFRAAGCEPACHVCQKEIKLNNEYDLLAIYKKGDITGEVMRCGRCAKWDKKIPYHEAVKLAMQLELTKIVPSTFIKGTVKNRPRLPTGIRADRSYGGFLINGEHRSG